MKRLLSVVLALAALWGFADKPNIILVLIDDMGWADFSCFGNTEATTPNVDSLAAEGICFHQFYVNSPICSPSRVAFSTGQYPHRHRITSYLEHRKSNEERGVANWLDLQAPMLARTLHAAGYATGHFGKWHMGGQRDVDDAPAITAYGFDESLTNFEGMGAKLLPLTEKRGADGAVVKGRVWEDATRLGEPVTWMLRSQITGGFAARALQFVDQAQAAGKPFYINLWPDDVHGPLFPSVARWSEDPRQRYLAVLEEMDQQFGAIFNRIKQDPQLRANTLILVCSDNGPELGHGSAGPFKGSKATLFEGGLRSPLVVWGPGLLAPSSRGSVNQSSMFCAMDLVPSLLKIAGAAAPASVKFDGEDISATLTGRSQASRAAPLFFRRPPDRKQFQRYKNLPDLAVRSGVWKYLCDYDGTNQQLYDVQRDPGESKNLVGQYPEVAERLIREIQAWNKRMPQDGGAAQPQAARGENIVQGKFVNPIGPGADPCVIKDGARYLWCSSKGDLGINIGVSDKLNSLGRKHTIWSAPASGPLSRQVWAPELIHYQERWYIYFAASDGRNETHLTYVLASQTSDPLGEYQLHGPLYTGDDPKCAVENIWAIDMTVLEQGSRLYALWSGWSEPLSDQQYLYIAPMDSPLKISGQRVRICANDDYLWERTEERLESRGLNEAPQVLQRDGRTFLIYSCGASWLPTYKLGMLELIGGNPLDPKSWKKFPQPVFQSTQLTFGVGHGSFVRSPDETQWWHVYHAKLDSAPGWRRAVFIQPMGWDKTGTPQFGTPVAAGEPLPLPSGSGRK